MHFTVEVLYWYLLGETKKNHEKVRTARFWLNFNRVGSEH